MVFLCFQLGVVLNITIRPFNKKNLSYSTKNVSLLLQKLLIFIAV